MTGIQIGRYRHYKGDQYQVLGVAHHSETLEKFVIYQALYDSEEFGSQAFWVRPFEMFVEDVTVDGETMPRFKYTGV